MSSSTSSAAANPQPPKEGWSSVAPYVVPPVSASLAIIVMFRDFVVKTAQQKGQPVPPMTFVEGLRAGVKAAPTVGALVGGQMVVQPVVEKALVGVSNGPSFWSALASSAVVGGISTPILVVFNGQSMGWGVFQSLRQFSPRQALAITVQETAFVGGLSVADRMAVAMRRRFGNHKAVDYVAAFTAGAAGSLAGHPANTALTRWQSGMTVDSPRQLMWGAARKARAVGGFAVVYQWLKTTFSPTPK